MELFAVPDDIKTLYIQAASFPNGVLAAHRLLREKLPAANGRRYFGISWSDGKSGIIYRAAGGQLTEYEATQAGLEGFIIRKGNYIAEVLTGWAGREGEIGQIFREMLRRPDIAPNGYCLEEYINDTDIRLMVTLA